MVAGARVECCSVLSLLGKKILGLAEKMLIDVYSTICVKITVTTNYT